MFVAWALFPLVLLLVCLGCGLLVERLAGMRLAGGLICSVGLAVVIVAATLTTYSATTAPLTTALVVVLALAGYAGSWGRVRALRPDPWTALVGVGVYAVMAAPVVGSGNATFAGYFLLNDTAVHFTLIDQLLSHGRDLSGVPSSAVVAILHSYISSSYPIGAQVAVGAVRPLVGQDIAWVFQPYLATMLALGAVALYELLGGVVRSRALRALCAFVAGQAGLLYAYYLEASIKELATTWAITLTVAVVLATLAERVGLRRLIPLGLVAVAAFDVLNLAIAPWLGVPLAVFALAAGWRSRRELRALPRTRLALASAGFVVPVAALAAPALRGASSFFAVAGAVLTTRGDLGNLVTPLVKWQMLGIWPTGDFRFAVVAHYRIVYALLGIALASAVFGTLWAVRRRAAGPLLLLAGNGLAAIYLLSQASPYASAKVMAIFSLTAVLTVMLGAAALHDRGWRLEGWALALVLAGGVLWTNAEAYRSANIAPRARMAELASIGERFAGQGPALYNLSDEFAVHFLRREAPADPAFGAPAVRQGVAPRTLRTTRMAWDTDELEPSYLQSFPLLVLGRSPVASRPPADYSLAYEGRYFEVWRRAAAPQVIEHVALGGELDPAAVPSCRTVMHVAHLATGRHAQLAYVVRPQIPTLVPTRVNRPNNWGEVDGDPYSLIIRTEAGVVSGPLSIPAAGRYAAWQEGDFGQRLELSIDGRAVGSDGFEEGPPGQYSPLGSAELSAGTHTVQLAAPRRALAPGQTPKGQTIGPLVLDPATDTRAVQRLAPTQAHTLCGQRLDWIEIVR